MRRWSTYQNAIAAVDAATRAGSPPDIERACDGVRDVVTDAGCSLDLAATICAGFFESQLGTGLLAVRASANVDDPAQMSGCGGHVSVVGVQANSCAAVAEAIAQVWASLFTPEAVQLARRLASARRLTLAVVVQEIAPAAVSSSCTPGADRVGVVEPGALPDPRLEVELAVGLGEALVVQERTGATRGG